jgi:predicted ATPase/DNA-binding SARP family transcriptional activator/transposase/uncharacterized protein HemY
MEALWQVELFGGLRALHAEREVTRFRTRQVGALLAYLSYHLDRLHPRDLLAEQLWPGCDPQRGRRRLSLALTSLRHQLEPPGIPSGTVLQADRAGIYLNPAAVTTDVRAFETARRRADAAAEPSERASWLARAVEIYRGPLLSGYYEDWILTEQARLGDLYFAALQRLVAELEGTGDMSGALQYARCAVNADPHHEAARRDLIRLLAASGQPRAVLEQFREIEERLSRDLGIQPSEATRALARRLAVRMDRGGKNSSGETAVRSLAAPPRPPSVPPSQWPPEGMAHLPPPLTCFFGRNGEIAQLRMLLGAMGDEDAGGRGLLRPRLVTLTGPGGSGKTRLALEVARRLGMGDPEGGTPSPRVRYVPLADLPPSEGGEDAASRIREAIRSALRLAPSPERESIEPVLDALSRGPTLLLLDNFEHLLEGGAPLVELLLQRVPGLTCLVTSRQCLGLIGEREFPVPPMAVPGGAESPEELARCESVQLFVERAQAVRPDFQVTAANAAAVAELCRRLEGIPLAIELAASRAQVLTPAQMLIRLEERFDFLVSRRRGVTPRHMSLRAAIEWSYHLLPGRLQRLFATLSIFRGGWTLQAAEAVCAGESCSVEEIVAGLEQLREGSLILAIPPRPGEEEGLRFRMLETLREFAQAQLPPEERTMREQRATAYYLALAERAEAALGGPGQARALQELEAERENLTAAIAGCRARRELEAGLRLASALERFWQTRGPVPEGRAHLAALLSLAASNGEPLSATVRARACRVAGVLACEQGKFAEARRLIEESLALRRAAGDAAGMADSLHQLGVLALCDGQYGKARSLLEECLSRWRAQGDLAGIGSALEHLGRVDYVEEDLQSARAAFEESLAIRRAVGDPQAIAKMLWHLGHVALKQGDQEAAYRFYEQRMAVARELGDRSGIAAALESLGAVALHRGDLDRAHSLYSGARDLHRTLEDPSAIAGCLCMLGRIALGRGDTEAARADLEEALALWRTAGDPRGVAWVLRLLGQLALRCEAWHEASRRFEESLALCQSLRNAEGTAASLEGVAAVAAGQGNPVRAARLCGASAALRASTPGALAPDEQAEQDRRITAVRCDLGEAAFTAAWSEGAALTLAAAIALARETVAVCVSEDGKPEAVAPAGLAYPTQISDMDWARIAPLIPRRAKEGRPRSDDRRTLDGILYVLRNGCRWQDLPRCYGSPATCWRRLARWEAGGTWERLTSAFLEGRSPEERAAWAALLLPNRRRPRRF